MESGRLFTNGVDLSLGVMSGRVTKLGEPGNGSEDEQLRTLCDFQIRDYKD